MSIKSLAGQTMWYGVSTVLGRFIGLLLVPIIGYLATKLQGEQSSLYAAIGFLNIIFTFGMETTFFRFSRDENPNKVFNVATSTILVIGIPLATLLILLRQPVSDLLTLSDYPHVVALSIVIIALDAMASMPFAKMRFEGHPKKYAFVKIANVVLMISLVYFFVRICPWLQENGYASSLLANFDIKQDALTYILISNIAASALTLVLLIPQFKGYKFRLHKTLWKQMLIYTLPLVIVGLGGMINDVSDKILLPKYLIGTTDYVMTQAGIYAQNFKLAALIIIFVQAFRMGAEPFFMKQSSEQNAQVTYARVMNIFIIICCIGILSVLLFYDVWQYYIKANLYPERLEGFVIIPLLLLSKVFYGIYYNLSVWFKLENKTHIGAIITLIGAAITLVLNITFIPVYGYITCAWASVACYGFMVTASYFIGRKYYPVPYDIPKIAIYLMVTYALYYVHSLIIEQLYPTIGEDLIPKIFIGIGFMTVFMLFALIYDRKEFSALPVIGKFLK